MRISQNLRRPRSWVRHGLLLTVASLGLSSCAELEVGAQAYKSINRAATEPQPAKQTIPSALPDRPVRKTVTNPDQGLTGDLDRNYRSAPEVFMATGVAKWDGARTLRGIWIAHPLARKARRVRIINRETRQAVDGALFRRDTTLSGPSLLVSSDAAQGLGLAPGEATGLEIYALERIETPGDTTVEQVAAEPADAPSSATETAEIAAFANARTQPTDATASPRTPFGKVAVATSPDGDAVATVETTPEPASDKAESGAIQTTGIGSLTPGETPETGSDASGKKVIVEDARPAPTEPDEAVLAAITAAVEAPVASPETATPVETPKPAAGVEPAAKTPIVLNPPDTDKLKAEAKETVLENARVAEQPTRTAAAETPVDLNSPDANRLTAESTNAAASPEAVEPPVETPAKKTPIVLNPPDTNRLAAEANEATPAKAGAATQPVRTAAVKIAEPAQPKQASATTGTAGAATLVPVKPYIQIGVFGVQENATRMIRKLQSEGLPSLTKTINRQDGTTLVRVLAGPFEQIEAQNRAFTKIRAFGIKDAIAVKG